ncbi:MAG TPA: DM13 domain-containing protein [Gemmatimonadales bacterium]
MRRRTWVLGLAAVGGIGWYAFRPELLFVRKQVNEGLPVAAAQVGPTATTRLLAGRFNSVAHETRGNATIYRLADAKRVLRLTDFATSNGPDVRVYLVAAADARDDETVKQAGFIELGRLKGTDGDQNYHVPADLDLEKYRAVTIWCRRFGVNFGTAPLAVTQEGATRFTVRVQNISRGEVLKLSNGKSAPFVSAPVLWVIHSGSANPIFSGGKPDAGAGLELLAETGNPTQLAKALSGKPGTVQVGADAKPVGADAEGPITPRQVYEFEISARPGDLLSTAWMFGQSNDLFYSNDRPIDLFTSSGQAVSGEMTAQLSLWDAGTEVNEEPGLGPNQGPRQATPDAGRKERKAIAHVHDRYSYPRTGDVLRMTITPVAGAMSVK